MGFLWFFDSRSSNKKPKQEKKNHKCPSHSSQQNHQILPKKKSTSPTILENENQNSWELIWEKIKIYHERNSFLKKKSSKPKHYSFFMGTNSFNSLKRKKKTILVLNKILWKQQKSTCHVFGILLFRIMLCSSFSLNSEWVLENVLKRRFLKLYSSTINGWFFSHCRKSFLLLLFQKVSHQNLEANDHNYHWF